MVDTNTLLSTGMLIQQSAVPAVEPVKDGSKFQNIASGISNLFTSASNVISSIKQPAPGTPGYNPAIVNSPATMAPGTTTASKPNYLKMGLIGLAIAGIGYGGYKLATRKKKSLSGVSGVGAVGAVSGLGKPAKRKRKKRTAKKRTTRKVKI